MADNLDDLLDEVEAKFCRSVSVSSQAACNLKEHCRKQINNSTNSNLDPHGTEHTHIESILQEILDDNGGDQSAICHAPVLPQTCSKESCPQTVSMRCCPLFLGGSSIRSGIGTRITQRACDQLRCTDCDFRVVIFNDFEWDSTCDYLFFRNNMPDCNKLRAKLKKRQGARAYACQCSWHSSYTLSELRHIQQLKWVCGQHTTS